MAKRTINPVYKCSDDSEHATKAIAEKHEALLTAGRELEECGRRVTKALAEAALTADGVPFDMSRSRDYWRLAPSFGGRPHLFSVNIWPHNASVDTGYHGDNMKLCIRWWEQGDHIYGNRESRYVSIPIGELYADKENAEAALIAAWEEWLDGLRKEFEELKGGD